MSDSNLDVVLYINPSMSDSLIIAGIVWISLSIIFTLVIIGRTLTGWLINPRITKQVLIASFLALINASASMAMVFLEHRSTYIISNWTFYLMTLMIVLQHVELLKLFVSLSDYWTVRKCRILQIGITIAHILICFPEYIWPLGLETNWFLREVMSANKWARYCPIPWVMILILTDNACSWISIRLMWKHLKQARNVDGQSIRLPTRRYYKVVSWIACHGFLDIIAFAIYIGAVETPVISSSLKTFLVLLSSNVAVFHVSCYPIVYCGVRDLKFHEQIKERTLASSRRIIRSSDCNPPVSPLGITRKTGRSGGYDVGSPPNSKRLGKSDEDVFPKSAGTPASRSKA